MDFTHLWPQSAFSLRKNFSPYTETGSLSEWWLDLFGQSVVNDIAEHKAQEEGLNFPEGISECYIASNGKQRHCHQPWCNESQRMFALLSP